MRAPSQEPRYEDLDQNNVEHVKMFLEAARSQGLIADENDWGNESKNLAFLDSSVIGEVYVYNDPEKMFKLVKLAKDMFRETADIHMAILGLVCNAEDLSKTTGVVWSPTVNGAGRNFFMRDWLNSQGHNCNELLQ